MEENKNEQRIDKFTKKIVKELTLESPSANFTATIMDVVSTLETTKSPLAYTPLISKKGWILIGVILAGILSISLKGIDSKWIDFSELNLSFLEKINISGLFDSFTVSNTVLYASCLFGVFISIQLIYLKGYFEKQLSV